MLETENHGGIQVTCCMSKAVIEVSDLLVGVIWAAPSEFGTYRLCEQRRFRRACASAQSRQNLRCSLIQAVSQEEPSDRKPYPWPLWMTRHAQLKFVMTECSKTQIRLTRSIFMYSCIPIPLTWRVAEGLLLCTNASMCVTNFRIYF